MSLLDLVVVLATGSITWLLGTIASGCLLRGVR